MILLVYRRYCQDSTLLGRKTAKKSKIAAKDIAQRQEVRRAQGKNKYNVWIKENREYESGVFTLKIDDKLRFSIEIYSPVDDKFFGKAEGVLKKINARSRPGVNYYYCIFKDYIGKYDSRKEDCIMIFSERDGHIIVNVFGDDINTDGFQYEGLYIKNEPLTHLEEERLNNIFHDHYDVEIVKMMLGLNIKYFLEIFEQIKTENINGNIIIEGWIPGGNRFTNGIIKIEGKYIYILFGDTRNGTEQYKYFTNSLDEEYPVEFTEWRLFPKSDMIILK